MVLKSDLVAMGCLSAALVLLWFQTRLENPNRLKKFVNLLIGLTAGLWIVIVYLYLGNQ